MKQRRWKVGIGLLVVVVLLISTGCGQKEPQENTLIYGSHDYTEINPALYEHGEINELIFAGLTDHDEENKVIPGLAESWTWDEGSLTYTFVLKEGLTFHDGKPLTGEDVKFTLEAILKEENQSEIRSNYEDIVSIECIGDREIKITLSRANQGFPEYMAIGILPKHLLEGEELRSADFNHHPIGAGPYKLTAWDQGQSITLDKFDGYYGKIPSIETIIFKITKSSATRKLQLEAGDIDLGQVTPKDSEAFYDKEGFAVYDMKTADYRAIGYNYNFKLFKENKELPAILSYGINRQAIVDSVLLGKGEVAFSPLQRSEYCNNSMEKFEYNPGKCEEELKKAGWEKGNSGYYEKNGEPLAFSIYAMESDQVRIDMAKLCASNLQEVGVDAKAEIKSNLDWEGQSACIIGWGSPYDPDDHTYKVFTTHGGDNFTYYSNATVDQALTSGRVFTGEERMDAYYQFQEEMTKVPPYTFLAYVDGIYVGNEHIKGISNQKILGHHAVGIFWNVEQWTME